MKRIHLYISGKVQGIFFRDTTKDVAVKLGVFGVVRNLSDGRVEVIAEGEEGKLSELLRFCRQGPTMAKVSDVEVLYEEYENEFDNFEVR